ncbi:hypothetical protein JZ751_029471 [Albula glossodonta]|uniref:ADP-ribosylhydrolase ARH1 n=1 Tax=Albula glossodonta TaxID=121402 RepID=A0A8T2PI62_9TELE|nr:hypothetical protein JZ751_029471 [Albula glossodonta]
MEKRYEASMVLSAAGDAMGFHNGEWEFCRNGEKIHKQLAEKGGLENLCVKDLPVSDDTVMHLATAEALVEMRKGSTFSDLLKTLAKKYIKSMDDMEGRSPGITCMSATRLLKPKVKKGWQIPFNPHGGGCGAAMRAMCVGLRFPQPDQVDLVVAVSVESGRMTHHHPTGYLGSLAAALFTSYAVRGKPPVEWGRGLLDILEKAKEYVEQSGHCVEENLENWDYFEKSWKDYLQLRGILHGTGEALFPETYGVKERDEFYKSVSYSGWGGSSGHDAPMIAYDALLKARNSWVELAHHAFFHGGDSDSTAAIAGACQLGIVVTTIGEASRKSSIRAQPGPTVMEMEKRYEASMVLSAAGDAMGYHNGEWEFCERGEEIHKQLAAKGGLENLCVKDLPVSDDTVMHLATAEALVEMHKGSTFSDLLKTLAEKYIRSMDDMEGRSPGTTYKFAMLLSVFLGITCMSGTGLLRPKVKRGWQIPFNPRGGGCGAAMRAMCVGLRFPQPDQVDLLVAVSVESGRMTHHHPTGYLGSLAAALFTSYAVRRKPPLEWGRGLLDILGKAKEYVKQSGHCVKENLENWDYFEKSWKSYLQLRGILHGTGEALFPETYGVKERDEFYKSVSYSGWGGSSGHDAPMIAYDALLKARNSWVELAHHAFFHGGDSDSTAAIAGAWWGAIYGFKGVPEVNYNKIEYHERLTDLAKKLYEMKDQPFHI